MQLHNLVIILQKALLNMKKEALNHRCVLSKKMLLIRRMAHTETFLLQRGLLDINLFAQRLKLRMKGNTNPAQILSYGSRKNRHLGRKRQYYYSVFFLLCSCAKSFFTLNKMLIQLFVPEISPLSSHLFFVHNSAQWFSVLSSLGINLYSEGDLAGIHGETLWSFKIQRASFFVSAVFGVCT